MFTHNCSKFLIIYLFVGATCHHINDTYRLLKDKLAHYDKTIRPTSNQSEATVVWFSFGLFSLHELDEVNQRLSVVALLGLVWVDDLMKWNPADYGNMTEFQTESGRFWTPNLILSNNAEMMDRTGTEWQAIRFSADGIAYYFPVQIFTVSCLMDVTFYPWDRHLCVLSFTPQGYPPTEMRIESPIISVDMSYYTENGAWKFINSSIFAFTSPYYSSINVFLIFERKPRFAIVNVILPIIFMSFLSVVVFLIPPDSGERISYTITMLLAIAVFLTLVGDNLPKTSNPMPIFSYYLITMLASSICITLATIFGLRLYYADESDSVPGCLAKLVTWCRKKKTTRHTTSFRGLQNKKLNSRVYIPDEETKVEGNGKINAQSSSLKDCTAQRHPGQLKHVSTTVHSHDADRDKDNEMKITWKDISYVVDIVFFILFFVIFIVATVVFFVMVFNSKRETLDDIVDTIKF